MSSKEEVIQAYLGETVHRTKTIITLLFRLQAFDVKYTALRISS